MNKLEIQQFIYDWLWSSSKRLTEGQPWPPEYKTDVESMIMDATEGIQAQLTACQKRVAELECVINDVLTLWNFNYGDGSGLHNLRSLSQIHNYLQKFCWAY